MPARSFLLALGLAVIALGSAQLGGGCVLTNQPTVERHPDGGYKLTCRTALPQCLEKAEEVCKGNRYLVTRAADHHDYMGGESSVGEAQVRTSEALFVCGTRGRPLWGKDADPMAVPSAPAAASNAGIASAPAGASGGRSCIPGATQQCTGPAACRGGQACLPDGSGFSSCDCGEATKAAASRDGAPPTAPPAPAPTSTPGGTTTSPQAGKPPVPAASGNVNPPR